MNQEIFDNWLLAHENENLEFKEAKNQFDTEKLVKYCVAIANEKGGCLVLGVKDRIPHEIVGTNAFVDLNSIKLKLRDRLDLRIDIEEIPIEGKRVLVFNIPSRPLGRPLNYNGSYLMRSGESLTPMTPEQLQEIFKEGQSDFSTTICKNATLEDLSEKAVENFRKLWHKKSGNPEFLHMPLPQLLTDSELYDGEKLSYAALILLGTKSALGKYLANSEIVFEYRNDEASIESQQRKDFREGFFSIYDELWDLINLRNDLNHIQEGFFIKDIPTFNEEVIREAILNAVCHRDYYDQGSVFIRQYPKRLEIESPGGFPRGITPENILDKHFPRNRRIAEVLQKCGLIERAGQGVNKMYRQSILESKPLPDYSKSDEYSVIVSIMGNIQDVQFLRYLEKITEEKQVTLSLTDLIILDLIRKGDKIETGYSAILNQLKDKGIIEPLAGGRGRKYMLSKQLYTYLNEKGKYTRAKGLDKDEKKALIIKHLKHHDKGTMDEFEQVLPSTKRSQIKYLLNQLRLENKIIYRGKTKNGYWELVNKENLLTNDI